MKKKVLFSSVLAVALGFATSSTFVSCKNYDDDISSLNNRVSSLETSIKNLESQITAGSTITDVSTDGDAIKVTLSNGKTYSFESADNADAQLVKVGEDGYLYYYDVTTGKYVKTDISADTDTNTYVSDIQIDSNGNLVLVYSDDTANKTTTITITGSSSSSSTGSNASAYWDGKDLVLNIDGESYRIAYNNALRSLVFMPNAYVDGVEALAIYTYRSKGILTTNGSVEVANKLYNGSAKDLPTIKETWAYTTDSTVNVNDYATPKYKMNPSTARCPEGGKFIYRDVDFHVTRTASEDFSMTPVKLETDEHGVLTVRTNTTGTPASGDKITRFAFQAYVEGTDTITSDYATLASIPLKGAKITNALLEAEEGEPCHIRQYLQKYDTDEKCYHSDSLVVETDVNSVDKGYDFKMFYNADAEGVNLNSCFNLHLEQKNGECLKKSVAEAKDELGFTFKYDIVNKYLVGDAETDNSKFAYIVDSMLYMNTKDYGTAVIGRTPIVRVEVLSGDVPVAVGYVRILIKDDREKKLGDKQNFDVNAEGELKINCENGEKEIFVKWEEINKNIYKEVKTSDGKGMSKEEFHKFYTGFYDVDSATNANPGVVRLITQDEGGATTYTLYWHFTTEELAAQASKGVDSISHTVMFYDADSTNLVYVTLHAKLTDATGGYEELAKLTSADYISNYWNASMDTTYYNVEVPVEGESDDTKDWFVNNLDASFVTDDAGVMKLREVFDGGVEYYFHKSMNNISYGNYKFVVVDDTVLYMQKGSDATTAVEIARIYNDGSQATYHNPEKKLPHAVILEIDKSKEGTVYDVARALLNTGDLSLHIGANAAYCGGVGDNFVPVTFNGDPYFVANYVTPVIISGKSTESFSDGATLGTDRSIFGVTQIVSLYDWRYEWKEASAAKYGFTSTQVDYYGYYAVDSIVIDDTNIDCDLNGIKQPLPTTLIVKYYNLQKEGTDLGDLANSTVVKNTKDKYGYLTYYNNGTTVNGDFSLFVDVVVYYKWGGVAYFDLEIPVAATNQK